MDEEQTTTSRFDSNPSGEWSDEQLNQLTPMTGAESKFPRPNATRIDVLQGKALEFVSEQIKFAHRDLSTRLDKIESNMATKAEMQNIQEVLLDIKNALSFQSDNSNKL